MVQGGQVAQAFYRNIVLFSDGTGNSSGKLFRTNVWRTYQALDLKDPQQPPMPRQFAYYDDGVGTSSFKPLAVIGGAFGVGLARNVRDLYAFLCRTYRPAVEPDPLRPPDPDVQYRPADKIYAFGFSRGAFTARVLVGLIMNQGLVRYDGNEADLRRNVAAAYRQYRRERYRTTGGLVEVFRAARDAVIRARNSWFGFANYDKSNNVGPPRDELTPAEIAELPPERRPIQIEFLGLWDTVEAYGLPVDELTRAIDWLIWPLSMPNPTLNPRVRKAMHALALDDERNTFHPKLWNETGKDIADHLPTFDPDAPAETASRTVADQRISQVWFAGVHSNSGGGYPDDALSYVPLLWILEGAQQAGLRFSPRLIGEYRALSDENGPIYDSRKGLASYYRYNPRRIKNVVRKDDVTLKAVHVHESVLRRIKVGQDGYAPIVLPRKFDVVRLDGRIQKGRDYLRLPRGGRHAIAVETEHVWNTVWRRRVVYFLTLFVTLALAAMPLVLPGNPGGACRSPFCAASEPIAALGAVLPAISKTWLDSFSSHPGTFLGLVLLVVIGTLRSVALATEIGDRMRAVWYNWPQLRPGTLRNAPPPRSYPTLDSRIESMRLSKGYQTAFRWLTRYLLPSVFVGGLIYLGIALVVAVSLAISEAAGGVCYNAGGQPTDTIETDEPCNPTSYRLEAGKTYRIIAELRGDWRDGNVESTPNGVAAKRTTALMSLGVPLRRHIAQPWSRLMLRIGALGADTYAPEWRKLPEPAGEAAVMSAPSSSRGVYEAEIRARSTGRLYLYVNDATLYPLSWYPFYDNNSGAASISVVPISGGS